MKQFLFALMLIGFSVSFAAPLYANANQAELPFEAEVFYYDAGGGVCAACPGDYALERALVASVSAVFRHGIHNEQIVFRYYNIHRGGEFSLLLSERAYRSGLDLASVEMPVFFTQDDRYFYGDDAIEILLYHVEALGIDISNAEIEEAPARVIPYMPEDAVVSPRSDDPYNLSANDSVIIYFYVPWCPFCYEIAPIMDNLPEYIMLDGRRSNVRLVSLNWEIPAHGELIEAYHSMLDIPPERQLVPLVLIGDRDLFLYEEVSRYLLSALEAGEGLHTPLFTERRPGSVPVLNQMAIPGSLVLIGVGGTVSIYYWFVKNERRKNQ